MDEAGGGGGGGGDGGLLVPPVRLRLLGHLALRPSSPAPHQLLVQLEVQLLRAHSNGNNILLAA